MHTPPIGTGGTCGHGGLVMHRSLWGAGSNAGVLPFLINFMFRVVSGSQQPCPGNRVLVSTPPPPTHSGLSSCRWSWKRRRLKPPIHFQAPRVAVSGFVSMWNTPPARTPSVESRFNVIDTPVAINPGVGLQEQSPEAPFHAALVSAASGSRGFTALFAEAPG